MGITGIGGDWVVAILWPILAVIVGAIVFLDARNQDRERPVAAMAGFIVGGLLLAGSVPSLVALAVTDSHAAQGFPTALRILPGIVAVIVYLVVRDR